MLPHEFNEIKGLLLEISDRVTALTEVGQKELLTPAEVCKMLKIGRTTYQRHVAAGVFDQVRLGGGRSGKVYVKRSDILRLIDQGKL
jgi:hypothetical protein